jgi:preprotein translocase subunit YajC
MANLLDLFISNAYAADATPPAGAGNFSLVIMLAVFIFFMYFAVWRPQSKRAREHRDLINSLTKGDEVVTAGGILGRIVKIADHYAVLMLSDNVEITIQKSSIVSALPKGTIKSI